MHCAANMPSNIWALIVCIMLSSPAKNARKSVLWSSLLVSIFGGMREASSGVRFWRPFLRTADTTSRGVLTPNILMPFWRANRKMSR